MQERLAEARPTFVYGSAPARRGPVEREHERRAGVEAVDAHDLAFTGERVVGEEARQALDSGSVIGALYPKAGRPTRRRAAGQVRNGQGRRRETGLGGGRGDRRASSSASPAVLSATAATRAGRTGSARRS